MTSHLLMVLMAGVLALSGCGKSGDTPPSAAVPVMDLANLQQAFASGGPEVQSSFDKIRFAIRYRQFPLALTELDKLARTPNLTDAQKKAVNDKIAQIKQVIDASTAKPAQ